MQRYLSIFILCQLMLCTMFTGLPLAVRTAVAAETYTISAIDTDAFDSSLLIRLRGDQPPAFTHYQLVNPARVIIDIAEAKLLPSIAPDQIAADSDLVDMKITTSDNQDLQTTRLELQVPESHTTNVDREDNDLLILIYPKPKDDTSKVADQPIDDLSLEPLIPSSKVTSGPDIPVFDSASKEETPAEKLEKTFQFSGYNNEQITVDFYKIDLHNVFRLFRQISGRNIVVDEAVKGSLTLNLSEVPWDFALDIILNLKNLKKEERFNTLVIYPASKEFIWPERAADNFSFEADTELVIAEALVIEQQEQEPAAIMQAKDLIRNARILEKNNDIEGASMLYEQALNLWPANAELANRLASIYLVDLGINARVVYFAQKGLAANPENSQAALYAGIASANMGRTAEAMEYFNQSISDETPLMEALLSYATFNEENKQFDAALTLLERHNQIYGESLTSMIATARIHDKMGQDILASGKYRAILASGFQLPPNLKNYIQARLALAPSVPKP
ncbi:MAG: secretin and TonB N-terminal domain-containing protein [Desulfobulbaceae bacterium]|uniref:Secretin and TonB N-terminal domain-containing protein n=1 Tax=Candidatus Desulfatifera sulfidica TaxID=2841691 RepID=A0A8J6NB20_9BACT|nr:secretin and TonB N-terminal domain-containing protein [Candidatus Desulfatifera sulfidica]